MILTTDRLVLRPATRSDAAALAEFLARNRDHFLKWGPTRNDSYFAKGGQTKRMLQVEHGWKTGTSHLFLLRHKNNDAIIGEIHFLNVIPDPFNSCKLSYRMDHRETGKGYMTEALGAALSFIFQTQGVHRVVANVMEGNHPSLRVLEKNGFEREGIARQFMLVNGVREDHIIMAKIHV